MDNGKAEKYSAPYLLQAQDWLRRNHKITIDVMYNVSTKKYGYLVTHGAFDAVTQLRKFILIGEQSQFAYDSYEDALENGVIYVCNYLNR